MKHLAIILIMLATTTAVHAQQAGPNGGMVEGKPGHEIELVVSPSELTVYVEHDEKAHGAQGASLRAIVQAGGKTTTVPLESIDHSKHVGKLRAPLPKGAIVVVTGKDEHGDVVSARYTIK